MRMTVAIQREKRIDLCDIRRKSFSKTTFSSYMSPEAPFLFFTRVKILLAEIFSNVISFGFFFSQKQCVVLLD